MAIDEHARRTARRAHDRVSETHARLTALEQAVATLARCALCGHPCHPSLRYCHAHQWAEGKT